MTNPERKLLLTPGYAMDKKAPIAYNMGRNDGLQKAIDIMKDIMKYDTGMDDLERCTIHHLIYAIKTTGAYGKPIYTYKTEEANASQE